MKTAEARELGRRIAARVAAGEREGAYALLAPALAGRTPFDKLGLVGAALGARPAGATTAAYLGHLDAFLDHIAALRTEGGWVVIGKALGQRLDADLAGTFERARSYIVAADVWYGADILSERVPGPALVARFEPALAQLAPWRDDANPWVRRSVGIAVHYWAVRSRGAEELAPRAEALLALLEPLVQELEREAAKGVGWGLKTLGRHYPDLVAGWLAEQLRQEHLRPRALILRKAITYLPPEQRKRVTESGS